MSDIAIKAEGLSKYYHLGVINNGTLFRDIQSYFALKRGKEDPHSKLGVRGKSENIEGFWALKDLDFEIHQGDRVGIIGKNGAGKSTLLKVLSSITAPTEGSAKIKGRVASLLEVGTGFHAELTGRENIYLNGAILGMKKREVDRKLDEIIAFSDIEKHIDTPVKRYSSGMYVRLAFAVAAHLDSEILIADEVLAVGDASFQKKALGKMNDLSTKDGRTVLFVSHQMNAVRNLCNKGFILQKGKLIYQDSINKCIGYYLSDGCSEVNTVWKNDGSIKDPVFVPNEFGICNIDDTPITEAVSAKNEYKLYIDFEFISDSGNFCYDFYFMTEDDITAFSISPYFSVKDYHPVIGHNRMECILPANLFNIKKYRIELRAAEQCSRWILQPSVNAPYVFFSVNEKLSYNPYPAPEDEIISPVVSWKNI